MDPVTHALAGMTLSNMTAKRVSFFWILVISSVLPDIDYVTRMWGIDVFLRYHRGITHGLLALVAGPLFIAAIFRIIYGAGFVSYFTLSLIGYGIHLAMDLTNQYGTRILSPFDWDRYSLGITFIIDPYVSLALIGAVISTKVFRMKRFAISLVAVLFIVGYVGGKAVLKTTATSFLKERVEYKQVHLAPLPNDFLRWWYVAENLDDIQTGLVDLFTKKIYIHDDLIYSDYDPLVRLSKEDRIIENFLYFARFPYPSVYSKDRYTLVEWRELSYAFLPGDHFVARVIFDENGDRVSSSFRF